jgi:hypothetical protein
LVWPICDFTEPSAHAAGRRPGLGEHLGQRGQLGAVADHGAGAVRLDQADLGGRDPRVRVGPVQRAALALGPRRGQAERAAVAGAPTPLITA